MARKKKQTGSEADVAQTEKTVAAAAEELSVGTASEAAEKAATAVLDAADSAQQPASEIAPDAAAATQSEQAKEGVTVIDIGDTDATLMMLSSSDDAQEAVEEASTQEAPTQEENASEDESNSNETIEETTPNEPEAQDAAPEAKTAAETVAETEEAEEAVAEADTEEKAEETAEETETEEAAEEAETEAEEPAENTDTETSETETTEAAEAEATETAEATEATEAETAEEAEEAEKPAERISKSKARRNRRKKAAAKAREEAAAAVTDEAKSDSEAAPAEIAAAAITAADAVSEKPEEQEEPAADEAALTEEAEVEKAEQPETAEESAEAAAAETSSTDDIDENPDEIAELTSTEEDEVQDKPVKKKRHYKLPIFAGFTAVVALGSMLFIFLLFSMSGSALVQNVGEVDLPNFVGKTKEDILADESLSNFDLEFVDIYSLDVEKGYVVSQTPKPPKKVKENAHIIIKVSEGAHTISVPSIIGLSKDDALEKIKEAGLSALVKTVVNDTVKRDTVLSVEPVVGSSVDAGDTITINVAGELKDLSVIVPDIVGLSRSDASALLSENGLTMGTITQVASTAAIGTVISQTPQSGVDSTKGSSVAVSISSGATAATSGGGSVAVGHTHNYVTSHVAPNSTSIGFDMHTCTICGDIYYDNVVGPTG